MPVARYSACEIDWHRWEQPATPVRGVVPVSAIVPVFTSIVHIPALKRDHYCTAIHRGGRARRAEKRGGRGTRLRQEDKTDLMTPQDGNTNKLGTRVTARASRHASKPEEGGTPKRPSYDGLLERKT